MSDKFKQTNNKHHVRVLSAASTRSGKVIRSCYQDHECLLHLRRGSLHQPCKPSFSRRISCAWCLRKRECLALIFVRFDSIFHYSGGKPNSSPTRRSKSPSKPASPGKGKGKEPVPRGAQRKSQYDNEDEDDE